MNEEEVVYRLLMIQKHAGIAEAIVGEVKMDTPEFTNELKKMFVLVDSLKNEFNP